LPIVTPAYRSRWRKRRGDAGPLGRRRVHRLASGWRSPSLDGARPRGPRRGGPARARRRPRRGRPSGSFEGGFALDADRRPLLVLAAPTPVGSTPYPRLDLTDGDALAGVAAQAVVDAAATLLDASAAATPSGCCSAHRPPSGPAPRVDPVALSRPHRRVRRWLALLAALADTIRSVLSVWQETTAAASVRTRALDGDGTPASPFRVALTDGVDLLVTARRRCRGQRRQPRAGCRPRSAPRLGAEARADLRVGLLRADSHRALPPPSSSPVC
jgi:hypothetical protein